MFDEHAQLIALDDVHKQVTADPADINVLPEYAAIASPRSIKCSRGRAVTRVPRAHTDCTDRRKVGRWRRYSTDPRTVDKLFDGVACTCDDLHA